MGKNHKLPQYLTIIELTGVMWIFLPSMSLITLDRFFSVLFLLKYHTTLTKRRVTYICSSLWIIGTVSCSVVGVTYHNKPFDYSSIFFMYIFPPLDIIFIVSANVTYSYILYVNKTKKFRGGSPTLIPDNSAKVANEAKVDKGKIRQKEKLSSHRKKINDAPKDEFLVDPIIDDYGQDKRIIASRFDNADGLSPDIRAEHDASYQIKRGRFRILDSFKSYVCNKENSKHKTLLHTRGGTSMRSLYVPTLIIMTFTIFIMVPDLTYMFLVYVQKRHVSHEYHVIMWILYMTGVLGDSIIYIFLQPDVRKQLARLVDLKKRQLR